MRIESITAKNYRTIVDSTFRFDSNYCTISGQNNAGKSCLITLIQALLGNRDHYRYFHTQNVIDYSDDHTQWIKDGSPIEITYVLHFFSNDDSNIFSLIEKLTSHPFPDERIVVKIKLTIDSKSNKTFTVAANEIILDDSSQTNFINSIRTADNLFLHNSTQDQNEYFVHGSRTDIIYDLQLSDDDFKKVADAEANLQKQLKKVAKDHKTQLDTMLDYLKDRFDASFSTVDFSMSRRIPLSINLGDRNVEVPLPHRDSGTQNRTHIMLSLLRASRIRTRGKLDGRTTPIVVIEEPESFLHPSAQAEFGNILQKLSEELHIQIIVATHSAYMLNQSDPSANILLTRNIFRKKQMETVVANTSGDEWMRPFAEQLGIIPDEFRSWAEVISKRDKRVLLVEGKLDRKCFEFLQEKFPDKFDIPKDVEILEYGGKDALKNNTVVRFMMRIVDRAFITFDLDAKSEIITSLKAIELVEKKDFIGVGRNAPGAECLEGLLPKRLLSKIYAEETDLVTALSSGNTKDRRSAKSTLKNKLMDEFVSNDDYDDDDLKLFTDLGKAIRRGFS